MQGLEPWAGSSTGHLHSLTPAVPGLSPEPLLGQGAGGGSLWVPPRADVLSVREALSVCVHLMSLSLEQAPASREIKTFPKT